MQKASELISKRVISLYNGKAEGIVINILFNNRNKKAVYFIISDDDFNTAAIKYNNIYSIGDDAITVKNSSVISPNLNLEMELKDLHNPINNKVFDIKGNNYGFISDVCIDDNFNILKMELKNDNKINSIDIKNIVSFDSKTVIRKHGNEKVILANFKQKKTMPKSTNSQVVSILSAPRSDTENETETENLKPLVTPAKVITNYMFLINRLVTKNICNLNGEVIIKAQTRINNSTINKARSYGKLKELTHFSV